MDHEEREAAMQRFRDEGKSEAWIAGWWRNEMRHANDPEPSAPDEPDHEPTP